jgi:hypothetical protein
MSVILKNNEIKEVAYKQESKRIKIGWDSIPPGSKLLIHYKNGIYFGVENVNGSVRVVFTNRISTINTKEKNFKDMAIKEEETSKTKYEYKIKEEGDL